MSSTDTGLFDVVVSCDYTRAMEDRMTDRVESVGICGSDMHAYLGHDNRRPAPLILGHEAAGTIVDGPRANERVTINPLVNCGACPACELRAKGFAEAGIEDPLLAAT